MASLWSFAHIASVVSRPNGLASLEIFENDTVIMFFSQNVETIERSIGTYRTRRPVVYMEHRCANRPDTHKRPRRTPFRCVIVYACRNVLPNGDDMASFIKKKKTRQIIDKISR